MPFFFFAVVVLLMGALVWRIRFRSPVRHGAVMVEVLQRVSCGPRQAVLLVRVGHRVIVASQAEGGMQLLTELEGEDLEQALAPPAPREPVFRLPRTLAGPLMTVAAISVFAVVGAHEAAAQEVVDSVMDFTDVLPSADLQLGAEADGLRISGTVGVVLFMAVLTLLPAVVLMMTGFTRILIVLHFLRSAMGTQTTPPGQLLVGIAALLTAVVMAPTLESANEMALQPFLQGDIEQGEAFTLAIMPFRDFMIANTRDDELGTMAEIRGEQDVNALEELSTVTLMAAFVLSELKTAFIIGFVIFLPFTVLDLVVASVLMSMGMFMLPPVMVSLPFKLLLFVLADGWTLIVANLVRSFQF